MSKYEPGTVGRLIDLLSDYPPEKPLVFSTRPGPEPELLVLSVYDGDGKVFIDIGEAD